MGDEDDAERKRGLLGPYRWTTSCWRRRATTRSPCTACRRIPARRSRRTCSTASARRSGTRPRTASTPRRHCSSCLISYSFLRLLEEDSMRRWLALLLACSHAGLVAAGAAETTTTAATAETAAATPRRRGAAAGPRRRRRRQRRPGGTEVSMKDIKFDPGTVTIKAGDTVTWVNDDSVGHDVTGDDFKSGDAGRHAERRHLRAHLQEAPAPSTTCARVHPGMEGTVKVTSRRAAARSRAAAAAAVSPAPPRAGSRPSCVAAS